MSETGPLRLYRPSDHPEFFEKNEQVVADDVNVYAAMLNQTQISTNNNKYYYLEILSNPKLKSFKVFFIWGRVGKVAGSNINSFSSFESALASFKKKFREKAKCTWEGRREQELTNNSYLYTERPMDIVGGVDFIKKENRKGKDAKAEKKILECTLPKKLQTVLEDFTSDKVREEDYKELNLEEMPLGSLTKSQIMKGFNVLMQIYEILSPEKAEQIKGKIGGSLNLEKAQKEENVSSDSSSEEEEEEEEEVPPPAPVRRGKGGGMATRSSTRAAVAAPKPAAAKKQAKKRAPPAPKKTAVKTKKAPVAIDYFKIERLSSMFYSLFPVRTLHMRPPPPLNTESILEDKVNLLLNLLDLNAGDEVIKEAESATEVHRLDAIYNKLECKIEELDEKKDKEEIDLIKKYLKVGHCKTHNIKMELDTVFRLDKEQDKRFETKKNLSAKRMLLWHGSRTSNFVGILSQGLRIAPPEVPPNGYMFGKGLYFADAASKSANYCVSSNDYIYLLLLEVAVGKSYERTHADYITKLPSGYMSTLGLGGQTPNPDEFVTLEDGLIVPCGELIDRKSDSSLALLYDEYIVYNVNQVRFKYLLRVRTSY